MHFLSILDQIGRLWWKTRMPKAQPGLEHESLSQENKEALEILAPQDFPAGVLLSTLASLSEDGWGWMQALDMSLKSSPKGSGKVAEENDQNDDGCGMIEMYKIMYKKGCT